MLLKTLLSTVFAVQALASPLVNKRAYTVEEFTVTVMTTVTAGYEAAAASTPTSTASASPQENYDQWTWGYHRHSHSGWTSAASTSTYVVSVESSTTTAEQSSYNVPSTTEVASSSTDVATSSSDSAPLSTYIASSSTDAASSSSDVAPSSTYVAPSPSTTSSTSVYVAPSSTSSTPVATSSASSSAPSGDPASGTNIDASNFNTHLTPAVAPDITDASDPKYTALALQHHNAHRFNHSVGMVQWNSDLADAAKILAKTCVIGHNENIASGSVAAKSYGQNLAGGPSIGRVGTVVTEFWYNGEIGNYPEALFGHASAPTGDLDSWAHFSQVIWRETTHIGCWTQTCPGAMDYTVCNYSPPGNFMIGNNDGPGAVQNYSSVLAPTGNAKWSVTDGTTSVAHST